MKKIVFAIIILYVLLFIYNYPYHVNNNIPIVEHNAIFNPVSRSEYFDENFKTEGGESQLDVRKRVGECFDEIIDKYRGKRIAIFAHGYAISFFLLRYCKLIDVDDTKLTYEYKGKVILDKKLNAPDLFKLVLDDNDNVVSIENIIYDDIPFDLGI